jgi:hypothetical protein
LKSPDFIKTKFQAWAMRRGIALQGSAGERGERNYTMRVEDNIFGAQINPAIKESIGAGAGGELRGKIPKMSAMHSSSAMAINLFQHWTELADFATLARLLDVSTVGIESVAFEYRCPVCSEPSKHGLIEPPHLDFAIEYGARGRVGVECKLFEPFGRLQHTTLRDAYLNVPDIWNDIPACRELAQELTKDDAGFHRLGAAQLVKHILGLKFDRPTANVRLIYLYFDAIGPEAAEHRDEIDRFRKRVEPDPFRFAAMPVQDFIERALRFARNEHREYVDYLAERYL